MVCPKSPRTAWLRGKSVVVTGGAGFLGRAVVRKLQEAGCRHIVVPRRHACDLTQWGCITRLFDEVNPDFVLHLAAVVEVPFAGGNAASCLRENLMMSTHLFEAAYRHEVKKLVCIGSASSYPANATVPLREADLFSGLPDPLRAAYGIAKRVPLIQGQAYRQQYGFCSIFLIPTNLYGPGDNFDQQSGYVIPSMIQKFVVAAENRSDTVHMRGTGRGTRDFLFVDDCAEGVLLALEKYDSAEAVNLGSGVETAIDDLAQLIANITGYAGKIEWDGNFPDGASRRFLDITCARREFGFSPQIGLRDGLLATLQSFRFEQVSSRPFTEVQAMPSRI